MSVSTVSTATLGVPRIGRHRELKKALEAYWSGKKTSEDLLADARTLRANNWLEQKERGIKQIPSNDFSLYDHVLDTAVMVGAIPARYDWKSGKVPLETYFAMARGSQGQEPQNCDCGQHDAQGITALEMTKWFDTNYHYMVPELSDDQEFCLTSNKAVDHFLEAKALGIHTRPVILGPVTFLKLAKSVSEGFNPISLLPRLLPVYEAILRELAAVGADWVQIDEPALVLDLIPNEQAAFKFAYEHLASVSSLQIMLTTYFGDLGDNLSLATSLPVAGLHIDAVRAPEQVAQVATLLPANKRLSLGVINGRNIWRADLVEIIDRVSPLVEQRGVENIEIAPSCSLLHVPIDLEQETGLDADVKSWLAFAAQKINELNIISIALSSGKSAVLPQLKAASDAIAARAASHKVNNGEVKSRLTAINAQFKQRQSPFSARNQLQAKRLELPRFPTTTIGSFPQTVDVRKARAAHAKGDLSDQDYEEFLRRETETTIRWQEEIELDVLVHGEFERNDMVQYFGEKLSGFAFTKHAWVQSYGSRYVRPPIIYGDVSRPEPMTVNWWQYAQSLTAKPVKGMLTGPVTILNWSFVRDDIPRSTTCRQIALAIRDEVNDLEKAGAKMVQIDEAALREGLPLRRADWNNYLDWAVECFRICSSGVADETQIHTHMCYSEFNDIIDAIALMDADVISIETSRSRMELLDAFKSFDYPNDIGPGVYDIHSPRIPAVSEMTDLLSLARQRLTDRQIWINPDCGLKTRRWEEVRPALINMVAAAKALRQAAA